jgi:hypothetical protein
MSSECERDKVLTHACLKEEQYWLWSSMCTRCVCGVARATGLPGKLGEEGGAACVQAVSVWSLESLGQRACLVSLEKRVEQHVYTLCLCGVWSR